MFYVVRKKGRKTGGRREERKKKKEKGPDYLSSSQKCLRVHRLPLTFMGNEMSSIYQKNLFFPPC